MQFKKETIKSVFSISSSKLQAVELLMANSQSFDPADIVDKQLLKQLTDKGQEDLIALLLEVQIL